MICTILNFKKIIIKLEVTFLQYHTLHIATLVFFSPSETYRLVVAMIGTASKSSMPGKAPYG